MTRNLRVLFVLTTFVVVLSSFCAAQVTPGTPPFGTFGGGPDVLNLATLNAQITIPTLHKAGRAGMDFTHDLQYNTSVWYPKYVPDPNNPNAQVRMWFPVENMGWGDWGQPIAGYLTRDQINSLYQCSMDESLPWGTSPPAGYRPPKVSQQTWQNWIFHDTAGTAHQFLGFASHHEPCGGKDENENPIISPPQDLNSIADGYALQVSGTDGSAAVTSPKGIVFNPAIGGVVSTAPIMASDRYGNQITWLPGSTGVFTDTTGNTVMTLAANPYDANDQILTYTAPSGPASFHIIYKPYTIKTNFGCDGVAEYDLTNIAQGVPAYNTLVDKITLPDGSFYQFNYESSVDGAVTGRLASVTLPTGGSISYTYTDGNNGINCADGSAAGLTRVVSDGNQSESAEWKYARAINGATSTTTITDPLSNQSVLTFSGIYLSQRQDYSGAATGTPLRAVTICQDDADNVCTAPTGPGGKREVTTTLGQLQSKQVLTYDGSFNLTGEDDYDFGHGAPGVWLRGTSTQYQYGSPNLTKVFADANHGAAFSQIQYGYDGNINPSSISYSGYGIGTPLTRSFTYYGTGNVNTATDFNQSVATYQYDANCANAYPTSVSQTVDSLTLSASMAWNCLGGVMTQSNDANNNPTKYSYTSDQYFWRPDASTDAANYTTSYSYSTNANESALNFNGGASTVDARTATDGLGRPQLVQLKKGTGPSSGFDSVATKYDLLGRAQYSSRPYSGGSGAPDFSQPGTTTEYDALSRPLSVLDSAGGGTTYSYSQNDVLVTQTASGGDTAQQRQLEYDALGRLKSVCELSTATGAGDCHQNSPATGFLTKYSYDPLGNITGVTQNAQSTSAAQTRSYAFDALSRLTSESNPETGLISYTYDSDSTCGTSQGDLVKRADAVGNTICYSYDELHRLTKVTYSGTYAANTPEKHLVYDSASPNGVSLTNTKGRLAEAYTGPATNKITDIAFSYSPRGEVTDVYEKTLHSDGMYHVSASYWDNGLVKQLFGLPQLPTFTFTPDGQGRVFSVSASSGQGPVQRAYYNSASQVTDITYGSNDNDVFNFDPKRGSLCQYQTKINGRTAAGTFQWSKNGNLKSANFIDPFNWQQNQQTCEYAYDEMGRLKQADCGTVWGQSFSYDAFGNIAKDRLTGATLGVVSKAGYDNNTNRLTSYKLNDNMAVAPTYDANGNLTYDGFHTYSWDADGNTLNFDLNANAVSITYDALGRAVEQNQGGTYSQIVYGPDGSKLAVMNGQTLQSAFIALPGGATAVYNSSGLAYYRHPDWLGSSRIASTPDNQVYASQSYAPFGEAYVEAERTDRSFAGHDEDSVSGIYDAPFRKYNPYQGRWISPDPGGLSVVDLADPQSWNRYAYVLNSPTGLIDPLGLAAVCWNVGYNDPSHDGKWVTTGIECLDDGGGGARVVGPGPGGDGKKPPANNGQTFSQCMAANSSTFSLAGLAQGGVNAVLSQFGTSVNFKDTWWAQLLGGNTISGTFFGTAKDAAMTAGTNTPNLVRTAMGTVTTYGRNSSTIMSLNIARSGGLPQALSSASSGLKSVLGTADSILSMGMSFTTRLEIDGALAAAEAAYCAYKTQ
jgi:RHS repeat-associated protein